MKNTSEKGMVTYVDYSNDQQPNHPYTSHRKHRPGLSLTVIACEVKDWNLELSPWKGVSIDGSILGGGDSGSFWFDGWSDYAGTHALRKKASIYLSLGGKEDKTDDPLMATVGTGTKELEALLKADPLTERIVFERNSGGHFADSVKRLIKGILWTVQGPLSADETTHHKRTSCYEKDPENQFQRLRVETDPCIRTG